MSDNLAIIEEFLTRGQLSLVRGEDVFLIMHIFKDGQMQGLKNPHYEHCYVQMQLSEEEIATLARVCFPSNHTA